MSNNFVGRDRVHLHREKEQRAFALSLRVKLYQSFVLSDDRFADGQAEADPFDVATLRVLSLPESLEESVTVFALYPEPCVADEDHQHLLNVVVGDSDANHLTMAGELERILQQVDQHLLEANKVTIEAGKSSLIRLLRIHNCKQLLNLFDRALSTLNRRRYVAQSFEEQ